MSAFELLLLAGLLFLSAFRLWKAFSPLPQDAAAWSEEIARRIPGYGSSELFLAVALVVGCYWLLRTAVNERFAFWTTAILVLLPHLPVILTHNQLEWYRFLGAEGVLATGHSPVWSAASLLASLAGLVVLYRVIALRKLEESMASRGIDERERDQVILGEALVVAGMVAASLALTGVIGIAGRALGGFGPSVSGLPWTVLTVGGGATILLAVFVVLWFRDRENT